MQMEGLPREFWEMKTVSILKGQVTRAKRLYEFGALNGSITSGDSNTYGALGEIIFQDCYRDRYNYDESFDHDFISRDGSITVDVKTKRTTAIPRPNWRCSVAAFNTTQKCDFYFFIRVTEDFQTAYLLGYLSKQEFFDVATFFRKGDPDPDKPEWSFAADCYNVYVTDLHPPSLK